MANVTFQPDAAAGNDASILSSQPTDNFGTDVELLVGEHQGAALITRSWIKFAIDDGTITAGSAITLAELTLTVSSDASINARTIRVFRCKRVVVEGEVTWNIYSTGNNWGTAGASHADDREATDIGNATQPAAPTVGDTLVITLSNSDIQEMISGGAWTNNGFILQVDTESSDLLGYDSSDSVTAGERPKLYIEYTEPGSFIPRVAMI